MISPEKALNATNKGKVRYEKRVDRNTRLYCKFILPKVIKCIAKNGDSRDSFYVPHGVDREQVADYLVAHGYDAFTGGRRDVTVEWSERALSIRKMITERKNSEDASDQNS